MSRLNSRLQARLAIWNANQDVSCHTELMLQHSAENHLTSALLLVHTAWNVAYSWEL